MDRIVVIKQDVEKSGNEWCKETEEQPKDRSNHPTSWVTLHWPWFCLLTLSSKDKANRAVHLLKYQPFGVVTVVYTASNRPDPRCSRGFKPNAKYSMLYYFMLHEPSMYILYKKAFLLSFEVILLTLVIRPMLPLLYCICRVQYNVQEEIVYQCCSRKTPSSIKRSSNCRESSPQRSEVNSKHTVQRSQSKWIMTREMSLFISSFYYSTIQWTQADVFYCFLQKDHKFSYKTWICKLYIYKSVESHIHIHLPHMSLRVTQRCMLDMKRVFCCRILWGFTSITNPASEP